MAIFNSVYKSFTQVQPRQPGANTLAYFPLTTSTQDVDQIGTWTYSSGSKPTFGTYTSANVDCAYFNNNGMQYTGSMPLYNTFTFSVWAYTTRTGGNDGKIVDMTTLSSDTSSPRDRIALFYWSYQYGFAPDIIGQTNQEIKASVSNNSWHHILYTSDGTTTYIYVDGNSTPAASNNQAYNNTTFLSMNIGNQTFNSLSRYFPGYLSNIIIEDKTWTTTEITDYYNQTKGDYGIS